MPNIHEPDITMTDAELQDLDAQVAAQYTKQRIRGSIHKHGGDVLSMVGTTSDVVQILLVAHCQMLEAIQTATTVAQLKSALAASPLAGEAAGLLADIQSGKTAFPYDLKTVPNVIADAKTRAKVVHDAILAGDKAAL